MSDTCGCPTIYHLSLDIFHDICQYLTTDDIRRLFETNNRSLIARLSSPGCIPSIDIECCDSAITLNAPLFIYLPTVQRIRLVSNNPTRNGSKRPNWPPAFEVFSRTSHASMKLLCKISSCFLKTLEISVPLELPLR